MPIVRSGTKVRFFRGRGENGVGISIWFRVGQIRIPGLGGTPLFFLGGANESNIIPLMYANSWYFPSYLYNLVRLFDFVYTNSCNLHFLARSNTSSQVSFVMAYVQDIMWFATKGTLVGASAAPTEDQITSLSSACTSIAYAPCTIVADVDRKTRFYTSNNDLTTTMDFTQAGYGPMYREGINGAFMIKGTNPDSLAASTVIGDLYLDLNFECSEFSIAQTAILPALKSMGVEPVMEMKEKYLLVRK